MKRLSMILALAAATLFGQDEASRFKVAINRWSTEWPAIVQNAVPPSAVKASGVTVVAEFLTEEAADAVLITVRYEQNGKKYKRWQVAFPSTTGCSPEGCRFAASHFVIGDVDLATVTATIQPLVWASVEEPAE